MILIDPKAPADLVELQRVVEETADLVSAMLIAALDDLPEPASDKIDDPIAMLRWRLEEASDAVTDLPDEVARLLIERAQS